jgi:predicted PurR-regulated permease PerM
VINNPVPVNSTNLPRRRRFIVPPRSVVWILATLVVGTLLYVLRDLVLILLLSMLLAYLINPIVRLVESTPIKRESAVAMVYLGIFLGLIMLAYFLFPLLSAEINALSQGWSSFTNRLDDAIDSIQKEIVSQFPTADRLLISREVRYQKLNALIEQQMANIPALSSRLASMLLAGLLVPFFSYFFLRDSRKIVQFVMDRLAAKHIETSVALWCEINRIVGRYLRGLALNSTLVGALAWLGLWALGVDYPLLLGVLTGLANVVPYVGPIIGGAATALVALIQYKSLSPLVRVLVFYTCLKMANFLIIQPKTMGGGKDLHPVLFIASIIIGGHILGIIGMIIAVPIITILQESVKLLLERRRYLFSAEARQVQPYVC